MDWGADYISQLATPLEILFLSIWHLLKWTSNRFELLGISKTILLMIWCRNSLFCRQFPDKSEMFNSSSKLIDSIGDDSEITWSEVALYTGVSMTLSVAVWLVTKAWTIYGFFIYIRLHDITWHWQYRLFGPTISIPSLLLYPNEWPRQSIIQSGSPSNIESKWDLSIWKF